MNEQQIVDKLVKDLAKEVFVTDWTKEDGCRRNDHYCRWSSHDGTCEINGVHISKLKVCTYDWNKAVNKAKKILSHPSIRVILPEKEGQLYPVRYYEPVIKPSDYLK